MDRDSDIDVLPREIRQIIVVAAITSAEMFNVVTLVSREWHDIVAFGNADLTFGNAGPSTHATVLRRRYENHILRLLKLFPQGNGISKWDYARLSANANISLDFIKQHPEFPWCEAWISSNPNITFDDVLAHPEIEWNYDDLSQIPTITWDIIKNNPDRPWNMEMFMSNPNFSLEMAHDEIVRFLERQRDGTMRGGDETIYWMSRNPNLTWEFIDSRAQVPWDDSAISAHRCVTMDIVLSTWWINWDYWALMRNPNITRATLEANPQFAYVSTVHLLSRNVTWEEVQSDPDYAWDYDEMSANPNITWEIIAANPHLPWNFSQISHNNFTKGVQNFNQPYNVHDFNLRPREHQPSNYVNARR